MQKQKTYPKIGKKQRERTDHLNPVFTTCTQREIGFVAGFFDADGTIQIQPLQKRNRNGIKSGRWYNILSVRIHNTNKEALKRIKSIVGVGCVCVHSYRKNLKNRKVMYQYSVSTRAAQELLKTIAPLIVVKTEAVNKALAKIEGDRRVERADPVI